MTARLAALLVVLLGLGLGFVTHPSAASGERTNPHGQAQGCASCHVSAEGGPTRPEAETCLACHPEGDPHPSDIVPEKVHVPEGWPLPGGKLACATCHAEPACAPDRAKDAPYLRGGNVTRTLEFCQRCHGSQGTGGGPLQGDASTIFVRKSPHSPARPGDATDPTCAACHTGAPLPGAPPAQARLRTDPTAACRTCHVGEIHQGVPDHLGEILPAAMAATLPRELPLDDGAIACWTCHDVHGARTAEPPRRRALADALHTTALGGAPSAHPTALLALPAADGSLCRACHGDGP